MNTSLIACKADHFYKELSCAIEGCTAAQSIVVSMVLNTQQDLASLTLWGLGQVGWCF